MSTTPDYLAETFYLDHAHPAVREFVAENLQGETDPVKAAIRLFYAVRDGWHYSPELRAIHPDALKASELIQRETGHCLDKAVILIAACRAAKIPARLHLVKVKNHIAAEKMIEKLGSDELTPHAFVELWLHEQWIGITPAFNKTLCEKLDVDPLEFDGENPCLFQQFSRTGGRFMEYLADYGSFADYPYEFVKANLIAHYPAAAALYTA